MKQADETCEPPSCLQQQVFMIGRNSAGNWVAQERSGVRGGLFINRAEALKFARSESGNHPRAVVWVNGPLELNTGSAPAATSDQRLVGNPLGRLQAA